MQPRRKTRIEDLRRAELIAAAHRVFLEHGLDGLTSARICREAGMSPGILAYYFKGKEEALYEMVRFNNRQLVVAILARMQSARSPWDRLMAIIEGNFAEDAFSRNVAAAWVSVCAAATKNPQYEKLQMIFYRRLGSNLRTVFGTLLDPARQDRLILAIGGMIDGLWLRKAAGSPITRDEAIALVAGMIRDALDAGEVATLQGPLASA
jgi:TetR/AcrR family transcriptional repressor of bet genes